MANLLERIQNVFKDEMATKVDASLTAMKPEPEQVFSVPISSEAFKAQITAEWVDDIKNGNAPEEIMASYYWGRTDQFNRFLPLPAEAIEASHIEREAYRQCREEMDKDYGVANDAENESYGYGSIPMESQKVVDPVVVSQISSGSEIEKYRAETFKNIVSSWAEYSKSNVHSKEELGLYYSGKIDQFNDSLAWKHLGLSAAQIADLRIDYMDVDKQVNLACLKASGCSEELISRMHSQSRGMEI